MGYNNCSCAFHSVPHWCVCEEGEGRRVQDFTVLQCDVGNSEVLARQELTVLSFLCNKFILDQYICT